jgi:16S rRNA (uracil1498-N3)-methyltransferase
MQIAATPKTRLFSTEAVTANSRLWLTGERAKYLMRVLRLKPDDKLILFDGDGDQYAATVEAFDRDRVLLRVGGRQRTETESPLRVRLVQGISRGGRMDIVVQKSTELGVRRITPVITNRSVVRLDGERATKRQEHWRRISQSACEQCGRNTLPVIDPPQTLVRWLRGMEDDGSTRILLDRDGGVPIATLPAPATTVEIVIGPEGGLSRDEYRLCIDSGFEGVSLGPRVLRTETAAIAAIAVLQALWGDLG